MPIQNSVAKIYPGKGSPSTVWRHQDAPAPASATVIAAVFGTAADAYTTFQGSGPVRQGYIRVKTEAAVASFLVTQIVGKDASGVQYVLFHGDVATALTGVASAIVDTLEELELSYPKVDPARRKELNAVRLHLEKKE